MKLYDQVQNGALDKPNSRLKNIRFTTTAGPHRVGVAFRRRTFAESDDVQQMFAPGGGQDRMYRINSFQVRGPFNPKGVSATPSRDRIFSCYPPQRARRRRRRRSARRQSSRRWPAAPTGARSPPTTPPSCSSTTSRALRTAASRAACAARSPASWRARSSSIAASACPPAWPPAAPRHHRSRAGVEAVVLPLEHDPRRRAAASGQRRPAQPARGARSAGEAHAGRSALDHAGRQLPAAVAGHEAAGRDRARPGRAALRVGRVRTRATTSAPNWRSSPTASSARTAAWWICCGPAIPI